MRRGILSLSATGLVLLALLGGCQGQRTRILRTPCSSHRGTSAEATFVATVATDHGAVDLVDAATGRAQCSLLADGHDGLVVNRVVMLRPGQLLVTYAAGPACSNGTAGCASKPHTCGAQIDQVDVATGATKVLWREGHDVLLQSAAASPDGREIAALVSPCVPSYFNQHLVVRSIADGRTWTLGAGLARCHFIGPPVWTRGGSDLLVSYAQAAGSPYTGADGMCLRGYGDSMLVEVDAHHSQPGVVGKALLPPAGCTYQAVAPGATLDYAVRACGGDERRLDGPASLVRLGAQLQPQRSWALGDCTDGNDLAVNERGQVLVSIYLYCDSPPPGTPAKGPVTVLDRLDGEHLTHVTTVAGGTTAFESMAWWTPATTP